MKSRSLKLILVLSLLFNFSIIAAAGYFFFRDGSCRVEPDRAVKRQAMLAKKLDLSAEQQKAIAASDASFRESIEGSRKELASKREALFGLIREEKPDRAAIEARVAEISALQGRMEGQVIEHILSEKAVLNQEQHEAYMRLLEKRFKKARSHGERPGFFGPGR